MPECTARQAKSRMGLSPPCLGVLMQGTACTAVLCGLAIGNKYFGYIKFLKIYYSVIVR